MTSNNGHADVVDPVDAVIEPLRETRDRLVAERDAEITRLSTELADAKSRGSAEIKRLDRILRAAEPRQPRAKPGPKLAPGEWISAEMIEHARETLRLIDGEFTVPELQKMMEVAEATARKAIRALLADGDLVKVGYRPESGTKAIYYAKVDG